MIATCALPGVEEGVVGQAVEQRGLLHDLEDRVLDRRSIRTRKRVEVKGDDSDPIRELLYRTDAQRRAAGGERKRTHRRISALNRASRSGRGSRAR